LAAEAYGNGKSDRAYSAFTKLTKLRRCVIVAGMQTFTQRYAETVFPSPCNLCDPHLFPNNSEKQRDNSHLPRCYFARLTIGGSGFLRQTRCRWLLFCARNSK
jgi:hypothetical protein